MIYPVIQIPSSHNDRLCRYPRKAQDVSAVLLLDRTDSVVSRWRSATCQTPRQPQPCWETVSDALSMLLPLRRCFLNWWPQSPQSLFQGLGRLCHLKEASHVGEAFHQLTGRASEEAVAEDFPGWGSVDMNSVEQDPPETAAQRCVPKRWPKEARFAFHSIWLRVPLPEPDVPVCIHCQKLWARIMADRRSLIW